MADDVMSLSTQTMEPPSKSVTRVQKLPNVAAWNDSNAVLRDFVKSFFSRRTRVLRLKHEMPTRKRVVILTDDVLLVYETNCTGYSFDIRSALKLKTSCTGNFGNNFEKSCIVTLKYKFGSVNLVLVNFQISVWRRTLSTIFEGECFDRSLLTDLSLYTAKDDDLDDSFYSGYTDSIVSLKVNEKETTGANGSVQSVRGCIDLSPTNEDLTVEETQSGLLDPEKTNSNRSLTCLPETIRSSVSRPSLVSINSSRKPTACQDPISIRHGNRCVSYLTKKFEQKLASIGRKIGGETRREEQKSASPPLECLFPPLPTRKVPEEDLRILHREHGLQVSKLDLTVSKKGKKMDNVIVIDD